MYQNDAEKMKSVAQKIKTQFKSILYARRFRRAKEGANDEVTEITPLFARANDDDNNDNNGMKEEKLSVLYENFDHNECATNPWRIPTHNLLLNFFRWPITFILWCTIPDCRRYQRLYLVSFVNCVAWILLLSYLIASLITVVGKQTGKFLSFSMIF
jgi:hypothetical protein